MFSMYIPLLLALSVSPLEAPLSPDPEAGHPLHVVIIEGINKDPEQQRSKDRNVMRLQNYFSTVNGVPASQMHVLCPEETFVTAATGVSRANAIRAIFQSLESLGADDRLLVYYLGQANLAGESLRLNIPGPDLTDNELAAMLQPIQPGLMMVVLDCPNAGHATELLTGSNRVLVFGARSDQPYSPRFSDYFIAALLDVNTDSNADGRLTLIEAFQRVAMDLDSLYESQDLMKSETPLLEDDGDGTPSERPWAFAREGNDGAVAAKLILNESIVLYNEASATNSTESETAVGLSTPANETLQERADRP